MEPIDLKFIRQISSHLRNFKQKSDKLFNFSCWYCGDSEKNPKKARAYLYEKDRSCLYHCHNCGKTTSLKNFLKDLDYEAYKEYLKNTLSDTDLKISKDLLKPVIKKLEKNIFDSLESIASLDKNHMAKRYVIERKIPEKWYSQLYFCPEFKKFTNNLVPGKFKSNSSDARLLIPFYTKNGEVFGYQGRALYETTVRYITIILNDNYAKFWNINNVDFNKKFYITEGPIDAMFLDNAIAICGSEIQVGLKHLNCNESNAVLVYDNDSRNKDIVKQYHRAIKNEYNVFIWPSNIEEKDINDCILSGWNASEFQALIDTRTFNGLRAELEFNEWKKV